jgi:predicted TIM-barrel fold metal-dependent hydrolase
MLIVDSQVHIWAGDSPDRPWPTGTKERAREHGAKPLSAEVLLEQMNAVGVDRAILVPPSFEGDRNDVVLEAAQKYAPRFGVMGRITLNQPEKALQSLEDWKMHPGALGVRLTFSAGFSESRGIGHSWLTDGTANWFWPVAEQRQIPVMINGSGSGSLEPLRDIARSYPKLKMTVDHFGLAPSEKDEAALAGVRRTSLLASEPNISVKASCGPLYTTAAYPFPIVQECIQLLVDSFGSSRVFWGSDLSRLPCTYKESVELVRSECAFLSQEDRELVLGRGLMEWLDWN